MHSCGSEEGTEWNRQQGVTLSVHISNRQSRMVCKSNAERSNRNSVTAEKKEKKKKKDQQPGKLWSSQMGSWVTQVIKSVIQYHIKQQAGTNRDNPPGRLAYKHAGNTLVT